VPFSDIMRIEPRRFKDNLSNLICLRNNFWLADRKANKHTLPIPEFKVGGQHSPWNIHVEELAQFIDTVALEAKTAKRRTHTT